MNNLGVLAKLTIGTSSMKDLIKQAKKQGVCFDSGQDTLPCGEPDSHWSLMILSGSPWLSEPLEVEVVEVYERPPNIKGRATLRQFYNYYLKQGLCLCPAQTSLELLLCADQVKPFGDVRLACKPVECSGCYNNGKQDNILSMSYNRRGTGDYQTVDGERKQRFEIGRSIGGTPGNLEWDTEGTFLFCRENPKLIELGFKELPKAVNS